MYFFSQGGTELNFGTSRGLFPLGPLLPTGLPVTFLCWKPQRLVLSYLLQFLQFAICRGERRISNWGKGDSRCRSIRLIHRNHSPSVCGENSFAYRGAMIRNFLPNDCKITNTLPSFKMKLNTILAMAPMK